MTWHQTSSHSALSQLLGKKQEASEADENIYILYGNKYNETGTLLRKEASNETIEEYSLVGEENHEEKICTFVANDDEAMSKRMILLYKKRMNSPKRRRLQSNYLAHSFSSI